MATRRHQDRPRQPQDDPGDPQRRPQGPGTPPGPEPAGPGEPHGGGRGEVSPGRLPPPYPPVAFPRRAGGQAQVWGLLPSYDLVYIASGLLRALYVPGGSWGFSPLYVPGEIAYLGVLGGMLERFVRGVSWRGPWGSEMSPWVSEDVGCPEAILEPSRQPLCRSSVPRRPPRLRKRPPEAVPRAWAIRIPHPAGLGRPLEVKKVLGGLIAFVPSGLPGRRQDYRSSLTTCLHNHFGGWRVKSLLKL